jgi:hypothetical protein
VPTLHFSYSNGGKDLDTCDEPLMSPYTIAWNMNRFLRQKAAEIGYDYHYQNLDETTPCAFDPKPRSFFSPIRMAWSPLATSAWCWICLAKRIICF